MSPKTIARWLANDYYKGKAPVEQVAPQERTVSQEQAGDSHTVTTRSMDIKSPEEALAAVGVDYNRVEIIKQRVSTSEVTMSAGSSGTGAPETYTNFHVYVEWKNPAWREALADLIDTKVKPYNTPRKRYSESEHLLIPSLYDHHFGKLAWAPETGVDYDIKIAENLFTEAIANMLSKAAVFGIDRIVLPIGHDFLHIDNIEGTTAAGTPQDVDSRLVKIINTASRAVTTAVSQCLQVAPVDIVWVPGNHDPQTSYYLCKILEAYYRTTDDVTVDVSPMVRKFITYGVSLIGMTHGSEEKIADLPLIMASSEPEAWAAAEHREWHIGHVHKKKEMRTVTADSFGPVLVRVLPSLCGTDAWHYKKGYVAGNRAAEAYLYHKEHGYAGHISANISEIER